ncbi:MAG: hypothetical protein HKN07_11615 [Acidimicrobiia bacterium]|nr:hypothetical protein [Acidimicrobiia bacterium]
MSTSTVPTRSPRPPLSTVDRTILALHGIVATVLGIISFASATDPGFGSLQRIVIVMLVGLWIGGVVLMGVIARYAISSVAGRIALLLVGPFIGIALLMGRSYLG